MLYDGLGLFRMCFVVVDSVYQVMVIRSYFNIVIVGYQLPLHIPGLTGGTRHDSYRVAGHDPFEVTGHVVAF